MTNYKDTLRTTNRLLTALCVLLAVCAGLLAKIAADTHAARPRPFNVPSEGDIVADMVRLADEGKRLRMVWTDPELPGMRPRLIGE